MKFHKIIQIVVKLIREYSKFFLFILGFFLTLFVGFIRYFSGPELALSLFYLLPIFLVTWFVGRYAGVLISLISAISWLVADLTMLDNFSSLFIPFINETLRLIVFLFVTFILSELRMVIENLKELARTDPLTGAANRRAFFELAAVEINRARRFNHPFSAAYIDVDNFKVINDRFGHSAGDNLLCSVAEIIKRNIREIDIMARLGGDEFIILFLGVGAESSYSVISKIQRMLLDEMKENEWPVTFSIGVVTFDKPPRSVNEVVKEADEFMYFAKQCGKNLIKHKVID